MDDMSEITSAKDTIAQTRNIPIDIRTGLPSAKLDSYQSDLAQETIDAGIAVFERITGLKYIKPPAFEVFNSRTAAGGYFYAPSKICINKASVGNDDYALQTGILHELGHYLTYLAAYHYQLDDVCAARSTLLIPKECIAVGHVLVALEEGAADFFSYAAYKEGTIARDRNSDSIYGLLALRSPHKNDGIKYPLRLKKLYDMIAKLPDVKSDMSIDLREISQIQRLFMFSRMEESNTFERYVDRFRSGYAGLLLLSRYWTKYWVYPFGDLLLSLMYAANDYDSDKTILKCINAAYTNTSIKEAYAYVFMDLIETIQKDKKNKGPIGAGLDSLIEMERNQARPVWKNCKNCT